MANVKITELSAIANPASTDVLAIVDVTADITKKVTIADLLENAGDGTAAAPAFSFDSDPNTGVFLEAADKLGFSTNGTGRIYIDATGNVGIAKSNPTQTLDVNGTAAISGALTQGGNNVVTVGDTGTVTSTMIADGTIVNADVSATAEISVSKLANGTARQLLQTDAAGTGVEFTSNVDVPGTLDVTGVATFDDNVTVGGNLTVNGTTTTIDSTTLVVEDRNIEMGAVATPTDVTADGGGITLKGATDKTINWVNSTDAWTLSEHVNIASAKEYRINGTKVLDATSLGSAVVSSSLTSVGTIGTGVWNGTPIATAYIADSSVTSAKIADGTIVDADVNASAAIGLNKLATGALPTGITVASANIVDATIVDADISGTAEISVSKLASGTARQLLQTNAAGTGVQFTSNVDVPGTLDVTGVATFDANVTVSGNLTVNQVSNLTAGTESAPALVFDSDVNSGIYHPAADEIAISTAGTERVRVSVNGNVGINHTNPQKPLQVGGSNNMMRLASSSAAARIEYQNSGSSSADSTAIGSVNNDLQFITGGSEKVRINSGGYLGVGTSSPSMLLDVRGASNPQIKVSATNTGTNSAGLYIENQGQRNWQIWADRSSDQLRIGHASRTNSVVSITDSRVGIGETNPGHKLVVRGNAFFGPKNTTDQFQGVSFQNGKDSSTAVTTGFIDFRNDLGVPDAHIFADHNTNGSSTIIIGTTAAGARNSDRRSEKMRITGAGNVGIGTTNPGAKLEITCPSDTTSGITDAQIQLKNTGNQIFNFGIWDTDDFSISSGSSYVRRFTIAQEGNVGIGTSSPTSTLHLKKDTGAIINLGTGTTNASSVQGLSFFGRFVSGNTPALPGQLTSYIREERQGSTAAFELTFGTATTSDATERMRIDSSGNVGIGTTNPGSNLHVIGDIKTEGTFLALPFNGSSEGGEIQIKNPDATSNGAILDVSSANTFRVFQLNNNSLMQLGQLGGTGGTITLHTSGQERFRVNNLGNCGIGTSAPIAKVTSLGINSGGEGGTMCIQNTGAGVNTRVALYLTPNNGGGNDLARTAAIKSRQDTAGNYANLEFYTSASAAPERRMTISSDGKFFINTTDDSLYGNNASNQQGLSYVGSEFGLARWSDNIAYFNRMGTDGAILRFIGQGNNEGSISVSGSTVSLNGGHLSRWSQLAGNAERIEILRGTVLSNLDEMCEWGDEDNEQLNRMQVSDVEGDRNVAGVFQCWDDDDDTYTNDFYCAMTGDFVIRIAQGTTVARGDLLMSAGDGTAKPQDDDLVRSKTIAKVTSTTVSATYADGSYCVPCVLMAC